MGLLNDKVCLVTGASRGIGFKTVQRFAEEGALVYANARSRSDLEGWSETWNQHNHNHVRILYFDVCDEEASKRAYMQIKKESGKLDVLVNNAGVMKDALIGMISESLLQEVFNTNVFGAIKQLQLSVKLMRRQNSGSIINLSSVAGVNGIGGQLVYSASKGAVASMTKAASKELAPVGIRVNAVAPGMIDTDMFQSIGQERMTNHLNNISIGRFGKAKEVADMIVFLASDLSAYITGDIICVDGGAVL